MVRTVLATSNKHSMAKPINHREVANIIVGELCQSNKLTDFALELDNTYPSAMSWKPATIARCDRFETVCQKSSKVQRRTELSNQTLPANFVGATALDAKRH